MVIKYNYEERWRESIDPKIMIFVEKFINQYSYYRNDFLRNTPFIIHPIINIYIKEIIRFVGCDFGDTGFRVYQAPEKELNKALMCLGYCFGITENTGQYNYDVIYHWLVKDKIPEGILDITDWGCILNKYYKDWMEKITSSPEIKNENSIYSTKEIRKIVN